jgi:hypothetical protein
MKTTVKNHQIMYELQICIRRVLGIKENPQAEENLQKRKHATHMTHKKTALVSYAENTYAWSAQQKHVSKLPMLAFWSVMPCGLVDRYQDNPEDGSIMFLQNVGIYLQVHTALQPR